MNESERLRAGLGAVLAGADGPQEAADRLCHACVDLLEVDGAAISLTHAGSARGNLGASGDLSRRLDSYQFTLGEGPCLDAVRRGGPVLVADLADRHADRWPAFTSALVEHGVSAVFALPVSVASSPVGALDLFRHQSGSLSARDLSGGLWAAELAALPLLDLMSADGAQARREEDGWEQLAALERVEVYQATGMLMEQLGVGSVEALVRLRAYAFARGLTASEVAWEVVERRLSLDVLGLETGGTADTS